MDTCGLDSLGRADACVVIAVGFCWPTASSGLQHWNLLVVDVAVACVVVGGVAVEEEMAAVESENQLCWQVYVVVTLRVCRREDACDGTPSDEYDSYAGRASPYWVNTAYLGPLDELRLETVADDHPQGENVDCALV